MPASHENFILSDIMADMEVMRDELTELAHAIWEHPELCYNEHFALAGQKELLEKHGFKVETPFCGIDTAFRAEAGKGPYTFAIAAEYDALPGIGHGCGHNLICAAAIGAFCVLDKILKRYGVPGRIVLLGTPAEESGGGKVRMQERGCLKQIDAIMMVHPSWKTFPDTGSLSNRRFRVEFHGKSAHAASAPELGLNALDGVLMLFSGINAWRQMLPETSRVHGIINEGGKAANIIPEQASATFFLRAKTEEWGNLMEKRFRDIAKGAALISGTESVISTVSHPYKSRKPNGPMNECYLHTASVLGMNPGLPEQEGRGSSDFGNFSQSIPGIHAYFGITNPEKEIAGHSIEFLEAANSAFGYGRILKAASAMAKVAFDFLSDEKFREAVFEDFRRK